MSEEISQQEIAAIAAARLRKMQRSQQQEPLTKVESKVSNPAPAKASKPITNSYWNNSKNEDIVKNPRHVADIYTNTPWIPQPQLDDVCAIAELPYNTWIDLEAQHIEGKWDKQRFIESAYRWQFRSLMRCVAISEDGLMATVSVSGTRKRLPLMCLWEMNQTVDI